MSEPELYVAGYLAGLEGPFNGTLWQRFKAYREGYRDGERSRLE